MIYGKNGSGKSTLGEALTVLSDSQERTTESKDEFPSEPSDLEVTALFNTHSGPSDTNDVVSLVFNERFIERHVKLKRDGLETVVLFGEQIQVQEELENAQQELETQKSSLAAAQTEFDSATESEKAAFQALQKVLRAGWAQRQKTIRGNSGASPVGRDVIAKIIQTAVPSNSLIDSSQTLSLSERIDEFLRMSESESPTRPWVTFNNTNYADMVDPDLLEEALDAPTGSGIAKRVGEALRRYSTEVHRARELFSDEATTYCPACLQDTSSAYKVELLDAISAAIDDKAKDFGDRLERSKLRLVELDPSLIDGRLAQEAQRFETAQADLNSHLQKWNDACEAKKLTMYSATSWDNEHLKAAAEEFLASVNALEERANEIDQAIQERSKRQRRLEADNAKVARLECDAQVTSYNQATERLHKAASTLESEREQLNRLASLEAELAARLMNAQVAIDDINASLRAIFAEEERLALALNTNPGVEPHYVLRTRGRAVQPSRLSIGERNIVALAYFFVSVRKRLDELAKSASRRWLVIGIDDPVSSMDMDNRLGIHGFLGSQMQRIFTHSHTDVKMVLLTHDLGVARELEKASTGALLSAVKERNESWKWNHSQVGIQLVSKFELSSTHRLVRVDDQLSKQNDYGKLVNVMWNCATESLSTDDTLSLTIGNVTRRVLEAFSTFIYNESAIPSQTLADEYARVTDGAELIVDLGPGHRMFLHENSHSADRLTAMSDFGGVVGIDAEEQIRHVRKVLAFMFTLQPYHVTTFLKVKSEISTPLLKEWCRELLGQTRDEETTDDSSAH